MRKTTTTWAARYGSRDTADAQTRRGRTHKLVMTIGLAVALVATLLHVAPRTADATNWTTVGSNHGLQIVACKRAINSPYGPLWKVTVGAANGSSHGHVVSVQVRRGGWNGPLIHNYSHTLGPYEWPRNGVVYLSRLPWVGDGLYVGHGELDGRGLAGEWSIQSITYC